MFACALNAILWWRWWWWCSVHRHPFRKWTGSKVSAGFMMLSNVCLWIDGSLLLSHIYHSYTYISMSEWKIVHSFVDAIEMLLCHTHTHTVPLSQPLTSYRQSCVRCATVTFMAQSTICSEQRHHANVINAPYNNHYYYHILCFKWLSHYGHMWLSIFSIPILFFLNFTILYVGCKIDTKLCLSCSYESSVSQHVTVCCVGG